MPRYFNFEHRAGRAVHHCPLTGRPASHGCIRWLERDARWLFEWGSGWALDADGGMMRSGTPVLIVGQYDFGAPPPWRSADWLARTIELPTLQQLDVAISSDEKR